MTEKINVWTYWHSEDRPVVVNDCIASWTQRLDSSRFNIVVLSENNVTDYLSSEWLAQVPQLRDLRKANQADFIRLSLLKIYGGIWLDASIYLMSDLSFLDCSRFYAPRIPVLDSRTVQVCFLVAPPDDYILTEWLNLYISLLRGDVRLPRRWYQVSPYRMGAFARSYFRVYSSYDALFRSDSFVRMGTPTFTEYGITARLNMGNVWKLFKVFMLKKRRMIMKATQLMNQEQLPSVILERDGRIICYKLNEFDREAIKDVKALGSE